MKDARVGLNKWDRSALVIQNAWKAWNGKRIFKFYKSLLAIWQVNNSCRLLKFINPKEAQLIEAATGLHTKFRLGGRYFPPTVYYKIFVHHPIIDMNSFSPRDYTKEGKQILPLDLFNNVSPLKDNRIGNLLLKLI